MGIVMAMSTPPIFLTAFARGGIIRYTSLGSYGNIGAFALLSEAGVTLHQSCSSPLFEQIGINHTSAFRQNRRSLKCGGIDHIHPDWHSSFAMLYVHIFVEMGTDST